MNVVLALVNRNLKVFLRNKTAVFFSFLAVLIIIMLYALFLGDMTVSNIKNSLPKELLEIENINVKTEWFVNAWIMSGLISVNCLTTTLGTFGTIVDDIENKTSKDFLSSPISRGKIVLGYVISTWVLSFILTLIAFIGVEIYIVLKGGELLTFVDIIKTILIIILSIISSSSFIFFIVTYIKSSSAFGTLSSIIGTLIGFLAGIYIPVGVLPTAIQNLISFFPPAYSASMLRQIFVEEPANSLFVNNPELKEVIYKTFGVTLYLDDYLLSWTFMIIGLIFVTIVFYGLSVIRLTRNKLL